MGRPRLSPFQQRLLDFIESQESKEPVSAADLLGYCQREDIVASASGVYQALSVLQRRGIVQTCEDPRRGRHYVLTGPPQPSVLIKCPNCQSTALVDADHLIPAAATILSNYSYDSADFTVVLHGVCRDCRQALVAAENQQNPHLASLLEAAAAATEASDAIQPLLHDTFVRSSHLSPAAAVTIDAAAASLRAMRDSLPPLSRSSEIGRLVASLAAFAAAPPPPFIGAPHPPATADTIAAVASAASDLAPVVHDLSLTPRLPRSAAASFAALSQQLSTLSRSFSSAAASTFSLRIG